MDKTIGFIGLGIMGTPMAGRLLKGGYAVVCYDVAPASIERVVALGAQAGASARDVAARSEVVISMVPDSPDVEKVYLDTQGVLAGARRGTLLIDMSTISPVTAVKVAKAAAERGCPMLDAPVSGGEVGAKEARLSIMVGGDAAVFERAVPIFKLLGNPTLCGASGAGQTVKACNQIQVALNFIGMAEALVLGAKAGVDPEIIIKVLSGGYAQTRVMDVRGPRIVKGDYAPGFRSRFHYKDLNIIRETARAFGACLPATALAHELFTAMQTNGWGDLDHSAVVKVIEKLSNCELPVKE
ncbi:MAG: 2-hydroxy-3-oxopropionate reductase [Chloroflexi bacterium]|nr:2-hydroxy-3-oxopropionate reductase [Chloroflexota bacterium]